MSLLKGKGLLDEVMLKYETIIHTITDIITKSEAGNATYATFLGHYNKMVKILNSDILLNNSEEKETVLEYIKKREAQYMKLPFYMGRFHFILTHPYKFCGYNEYESVV